MTPPRPIVVTNGLLGGNVLGGGSDEVVVGAPVVEATVVAVDDGAALVVSVVVVVVVVDSSDTLSSPPQAAATSRRATVETSNVRRMRQGYAGAAHRANGLESHRDQADGSLSAIGGAEHTQHMASNPDADWTGGEWRFADADDARSYLRDVTKLWLGWLVTLLALVTLGGYFLVITAFAVVVVWLLLARPMQARAAKFVPEAEDGASWQETALRNKQRDRAVRELAAGKAPLEAALHTAGLSPVLAYARWIMVAVTVAAFYWVLRGLFAG